MISSVYWSCALRPSRMILAREKNVADDIGEGKESNVLLKLSPALAAMVCFAAPVHGIQKAFLLNCADEAYSDMPAPAAHALHPAVPKLVGRNARQDTSTRYLAAASELTDLCRKENTDVLFLP
ncbi:hypothetical protein DPSP01_007023 [Paraphaeosphaeria sporulosa]